MSVVEIDDPRAAQLMNNSEARNAFPFINTAFLKSKEPCGTCPNKKKKNNTEFYAQVRQGIAHMPLADKAKLKKMLGATQVRVMVNRNGENVTLKF